MSWFIKSSPEQIDKISCILRGTGDVIASDLGISSFTDHGTGDFSYGLDNNFYSATSYGQAESHIGTGSAWATTNASRASASIFATETFLHSGAQGDYAHDLMASGTPA